MVPKPTRRILRWFIVVLCLPFVLLVEENVRGRIMLARYRHQLELKGERLTPEAVGWPLLPKGPIGDTNTLALATDALLRSNPQTIWPSPVRSAETPGCRVPLVTQKVLSDSTITNWEDYSRAVKPLRPALAQLREATRLSPLLVPEDYSWITNSEAKIPFTHSIRGRQSAHWLSIVARDDAHAGNLDDVVDELRAIAALGRIRTQSDPLVGFMVGVAIQGLGMDATWEVLHASGWKDAQLAQLQGIWEGDGKMQEYIHVSEKRRVGNDLLMDRFIHSRGFRDGLAEELRGYNTNRVECSKLDFVLWRLTSADQERLAWCKAYQAEIEAGRRIATHGWVPGKDRHDGAEIGVPLDRRRYVYAYSGRVPGFAEDDSHKLTHLIEFRRAGERVLAMEIHRSLAIMAIALKRHQLRHGAYPKKLEALVPEFLASLPLDPIDGKPLRYRRDSENLFTLYSVGWDGKDDGGDASPTAGAAPSEWWLGSRRDLVWPKALSAVDVGEQRLPGPGTGSRRVLIFNNADLRRALEILAARVGIRLDVPAELDGTVNGRLADVTEEQAIRLIVARKGCTLMEAGKGWRVKVPGRAGKSAATRPPMSPAFTAPSMTGSGKQRLTFTSAPLRVVLDAMAKQEKLSFILHPEVNGTVTATYMGVPILDVMDAILRAGGFERSMVEGVHVIHPKGWKMPASDDGPTEARAPDLALAAVKGRKLVFTGAPLRDVFDAIAKDAKTSLIVACGANGAVTGRTENIPSATVMKLIARVSGLECHVIHGVTIIHERDWVMPEFLKRESGPDGPEKPRRAELQGTPRKCVFQDAPFGDVVLALAKEAGVSMLIPGEMGKTVTARFEKVAPIEALKLVVAADGCELLEGEGGFYMVHPRGWRVPDSLREALVSNDPMTVESITGDKVDMDFVLRSLTGAGRQVVFRSVAPPAAVTATGESPLPRMDPAGSLTFLFKDMSRAKAARILTSIRESFFLEPDGSYRFSELEVK